MTLRGVCRVHEHRALCLAFDQSLAVMHPGIITAQPSSSNQQQLAIGMNRRIGKLCLHPFDVLH